MFYHIQQYKEFIMPDSTLSTLEKIKIKVRRLTRSVSTSQLTDSQLMDYINTFVLYDFPEHLRLFNLHTTFTFVTQPYVDVYESSSDPASPLYNFKNKFISVNPPVYIAGFQALYSQSRDQFFGIYPMLNSIASIGVTGNGATTTFTGVINSQQANLSGINGQTICLLQNNVLFSSIATDNSGLALIDYPQTNTIGFLGLPGVTPLTNALGQINYITGAYTLNFPSAPGAGQPINSQTVPQQPTLPQAMLYYDGKFTLRPVPDQAYRVNMEVFVRPTELLQNAQQPELSEWWQYIAYGAAKKVFEDRMDLESVQQILPEFKKQEALINRRTIVQYTNQRTSTIYTEQTGASGAYGPGWFSGGGSF